MVFAYALRFAASANEVLLQSVEVVSFFLYLCNNNNNTSYVAVTAQHHAGYVCLCQVKASSGTWGHSQQAACIA